MHARGACVEIERILGGQCGKAGGLSSISGRVECEAERPVVFSFSSCHGGVGKNSRATESVRRRTTCDRPYRSRGSVQVAWAWYYCCRAEPWQESKENLSGAFSDHSLIVQQGHLV
jgi:hypothetical protein